jgi:hypothetical protein
MTIEAIIAAIGCTEDQARELLNHVTTGARLERGNWTQTQRTIKHCAACGKRMWHDGDACIVCKGTKE